MKIENIRKVYEEHVSSFERLRPNLIAMRGAFVDEFWDTQPSVVTGDADEEKVEHSILRPWIESFLSGMYVSGITTDFNLSRLDYEDEAPNTSEGRLDLKESVQALTDHVFSRTMADVLMDSVMTMSLLYPYAAARICVNGEEGSHPIDRLDLEAIPPWELVFDRGERRANRQRYIGHIHDVPLVDLKAEWGGVLPSALRARTEFLDHEADEGEENFVRVLEFWDLDAGKEILYEVVGESPGGLRQLATRDARYTDASGKAIAPIQVFYASTTPERPREGFSASRAVYNLNFERNWLLTMAANAVRADQQNIMAVDEGALDEHNMKELKSGKTSIVLELNTAEKGGRIEDKLQWITKPGMSTAITQHLGMLVQAMSDSQTLSNAGQGKAVKYASATEVLSLGQYDATVLGMLRRRLDRDLNKLGIKLLRVLRELMGTKPFRVWLHGEWQEYTPAMFDLRWEMNFSEEAMAPNAQERKRQDFMVVKDALQLAADIASAPEAVAGQEGGASAESKQLARQTFDYLGKLFSLPPEFSWQQLQERAGSALGPPQPEIPQELLGMGMDGMAPPTDAELMAMAAGGAAMGPVPPLPAPPLGIPPEMLDQIPLEG